MSSIRQPASSSTLSTSSNTSSSNNAAHPASDPRPQYPLPAHHRPSPSPSNSKSNTTTSTTIPSFSPHHHKAASPPIHATESNLTKKSTRGCMAQFDFTYSGLYVSGSQYGRKTLGTGTGAAGSGECVVM